MTKFMSKVQIWDSPPALRLVASSPHFRRRKLNWHRHSFYELGLVVSGRCDWRLGRKRRLNLRAGDLILLPPETLHCEDVLSFGEARLAWIGFDALGDVPAWSNKIISLDEEVAEIRGYFDAILREQPQGDVHTKTRIGLAIQTILLLLARRAGRTSDKTAAVKSTRPSLNPRQTRTVESAAHYFRNNLRSPLSIAQVAAYYSLCPAHFSVLFQKQHRLRPSAFMRQARLKRAADLLAESDLAVKEIAEECGFVDAAHLCKCFKREHRVTPKLFRTRAMGLAFREIISERKAGRKGNNSRVQAGKE